MSNQPNGYDDAKGEGDLRALHFANSSAAAAQVQRQLLQKRSPAEYLSPSNVGIDDRLKYAPMHTVSRQNHGSHDPSVLVDRYPAVQLAEPFKRPRDYANIPPDPPHLESRPSFTNGLTSQTNVEQPSASHNVVGRVQPSRASHPEQFMRSLFEFMQRRGTPISSTPSIQGRQVNLVNLYASVMRAGGSQKVTNRRMWNAIASHLGFSTDIFPDAPGEVAAHFQSYLSAYEEAWLKSQTNMHYADNRSPNENAGQTAFSPPTFRDGQSMSEQHPNLVKTSHGDPWPLQHGRLSQERKPLTSSSPVPNTYTPLYDSFSTPAMEKSPSNRPSPTPAMSLKPGAAPIPKNLQPRKRALDTYGGLDIRLVAHHGREREHLRPVAPLLQELGLVDIHSLNMSLKSGLTSETISALNTIVTITADSRFEIELADCDDLLDSLLDAGQKNFQVLEGDLSKRPNLHLHSYAQLMERLRDQSSALMQMDFSPLNGGEAYYSSVEKFLCITTILRNLSFNESNITKYNSDPGVITFITDVLFACCRMPHLFKSTQAMLDVYKDFITILSNIAHGVLVTDSSKAFALLQLVVAFSPSLPWQALQCRPRFNSYKPTEHPYLALALDTLAKLLARHVPNRKYMAEVFFSVGESLTNPPYAMFAKAFALSISALPESDDGYSFSTIEMRLPMLEQGMLASEVLVSMAPPLFVPLRNWVHSEDAFVARVLRLVCTLSALNGSMARTNNMAVSDYESTPFSRVTRRGMMFLRELSTKTRSTSGAAMKVIPSKESLLGSLLTVSMDPFIVRQLYAFSEEEDEAAFKKRKMSPEV